MKSGELKPLFKQLAELYNKENSVEKELRKNSQIQDTETVDYDQFLNRLPEINGSLKQEHLRHIMDTSEPKQKTKKRMPKTYNSFEEMHAAKSS